MAFIPSGTFTMGFDRRRPEERFTHRVSVGAFWIDRHEVTNCAVRKICRGDRLPHARRAWARSEGASWPAEGGDGEDYEMIRASPGSSTAIPSAVRPMASAENAPASSLSCSIRAVP